MRVTRGLNTSQGKRDSGTQLHSLGRFLIASIAEVRTTRDYTNRKPQFAHKFHLLLIRPFVLENLQMAFVKDSSGRSSLSLFIANTIIIWLAIHTSVTKGFLQDQYVGCFYDNSQSTVATSTDDTQTIESCIAKCQTTYATIQNGNACLCREDYGAQLPDTTCNLTCLGNTSEFCGGLIGQLNAYVVYTVCPTGTYGAACDKGCHCKREVPCDRTTGNCPDGCDGNWSGSACNLISRQYIGCYKDVTGNRAMELCIYCDGKGAWNKNNTLESCSQLCADESYSYAGTEYMWQCFCGDRYDRYGTAVDGKCNTYCSGNNSEICGGVDALSVYSVCPAGNYGPSCAGRCHCLNDARCIYRSGSCSPNGCKSGWKGNNCSIRDCMNNNGDCSTNETCSTISLKYASIPMCRCSDGFQRTKIWENCTDIDECAIAVCDPLSTICHNTVGSYSCTCKSGFTRQNGTTCKDIDECQINMGGCDQTSTNCTNTPGSYRCTCKEGFDKLNNSGCTDIDECSPPWSKCGSQAYNCTNTIGSYYCTCSTGDIRDTCISEMPPATTDEKGKIAGAVVGSILGVALVVAVAVVLIQLYRRRNRKNESSQSTSNNRATRAPKPFSTAEAGVYNDLQETYSNNYSSPTIKELPTVINYKLSAQGVLEKEFKQVPTESKGPSIVGKSREVKKKNRFKNIVPYDENRVVLSQVNDIAFSDYINASVIKGYNGDTLIATQGPLPDTITDFWRMICEKDVSIIVMITDLMENNRVKCAKYWPENGKTVTHNGITVRTKSEEFCNGYALRHFQVSTDSEILSVKHWHFLSFPDHGVPEDVSKFMTFLKKVRSSKLPEKSTVVHCSAGAGRTGTFIAIDYLLQQGKSENQIDILRCLQILRKQRPQMIQTLAQYKFVHQALLFEYTVGDTTIPCNAFATKFYKKQEEDPNTGKSKLETELQTIEETKEQTSKENKTRLVSKSVDRNRIAEMDVTLIQGWKQKGAYISLSLPHSAAVADLYSLTTEFNCRAIILLDEELGKLDSFFPTKETPLALRSLTVVCDDSSEEDFGTCYKISYQKQSDATYANVALYENVGTALDKIEMRVLHVTTSVNSESLDYTVLNSLYTTLRKLNAARTESPAAIISMAGNSVSAFCLAALIAFEMITEEKEVDIFQIVQDIRKFRPQLSFSLSSYTELYAVVGQFINTASRHINGNTFAEAVYEPIQ